MGNSFERPVGAPADTFELEYISALHQTDTKNGLRRDGSIQAVDIRRFLKSRYGIRVTDDEVRETILRGLGGGDGEDDCIDLVEVVAVLLIPLLLRAVRERGVANDAADRNDDGEEGGRRRIMVMDHGDDDDDDEDRFEDNETPAPSSSKATKRRRRSSVESGLSRSDFLTDREYRAFLDTAKKNKALQPSPLLIDDVLKTILVEATGSPSPRPLTKDLIRSMFEAYGEVDLVEDDDLIEEMIALATGGTHAEEEEGGEAVMLDADAFAQVLTRDVTLYDPDRELEPTTVYYDVFGTEASTKKQERLWRTSTLSSTIERTLPSSIRSRAGSSDDELPKNELSVQGRMRNTRMERVESFHSEASGQSQFAHEAVPIALEEGEGQREGDALNKTQNQNQPREVMRDLAFDSIDFVADTYRSKTYVILSWVALVFSYISFVSGESGWIATSCDGNDVYGCVLARGILAWTLVMIQLSILGSLFIGLMSMGNSIFSNSLWEVGGGMVAVTCFTVLPYAVEIDTGWVNTTREEGDNMTSLRSLETLILVCGSIMLSIQVINLLRILVPSNTVKSRRYLNALLQGGNARAEFAMKQACTFKVNRLVRNACMLHQGNFVPSSGEQEKDDIKVEMKDIIMSSKARAMVNFDRQATEVETTGGFLWVWKSFVSGTLLREEGVWLHGRLVAGNMSQFFVCFFLLYIGITWSQNLIDYVYTPPITEEAYEALDADGSGTISLNDAMSLGPSSLLKPMDIDEIMNLIREEQEEAIVSDEDLQNFFDGASMQFAMDDVGVFGNSVGRDGFTTQQFREVMNKATTVQLSLEQISVLDRNDDGELSFDDVRGLLKSTFQLGIPSFERNVLVSQHDFEQNQTKYFWRFIAYLDPHRAGYPTPEGVQISLAMATIWNGDLSDFDDLCTKCYPQSYPQISYTELEEENPTDTLEYSTSCPEPDDWEYEDRIYFCDETQVERLALLDFCGSYQTKELTLDECLFRYYLSGNAQFNTTAETIGMIFDVLDKNGDGILSAPDVNAVVLDVFNIGKDIYNRTNIDPGVISDLLRFFEEESVAFVRDAVVERFFNRFDNDCNGELTREELFLNWFQLATKMLSSGKCKTDRNKGFFSSIFEEDTQNDGSPETDEAEDNDDDGNGESMPPAPTAASPDTTNPCFCSCGEFCNFDFGDYGDCESCSPYRVSSDCDTQGLPTAGAQDCKEKCFGLDCGEEDSGDDEEEPEVVEDITRSVSSFFVTEGLDDYPPKEWMVRLALGMGVLGALMIGMVFAFSYIPSTVSITLQFRSGVLPSLRDSNFNRFRQDIESVTMIFGSIFWGMLFTSIMVFLLVGGVMFVLVWQGTREFLIRMSAPIIGIIITILLKILIVKTIGATSYAAYYRRKPHIANIAYLALECWHLGITAAFMLVRAVKIIVAAAIFLGRIDRDFLAPGVGKIGPVLLDAYPTTFKKDILSADAHRHPYLERLGLMYMMKLRFGDDFARTSGSCWRLLFVFALMPWLRKHRILSEPESYNVDGDLDASWRKGKRSKVKEEIDELKKKIASLTKQIKKDSLVREGDDGISLSS